METPIVVAILIFFIVAGHAVQILFERDDWPFAAYTMYAHLLTDRKRNPFLPLRPEHSEFEAGFLVLTVILADGTSEALTKQFMHPLMRPFERLRVIRLLTERYKQGEDLHQLVQNFAAWIVARNEMLEEKKDLAALELQLYLWKKIPDRPKRHHEPDEMRVLERVEIG